MAVATRTVPAVTGKKRERTAAPPVSRRHMKRRSVVMSRTVVCILGILLLLCYIGLYAQVTTYGYHRSDLTHQIRQLDMENQALEAEIQMLSCPQRLAAAAVAAGMEPSSDFIYVSVPGKVKVAKAE